MAKIAWDRLVVRVSDLVMASTLDGGYWGLQY